MRPPFARARVNALTAVLAVALLVPAASSAQMSAWSEYPYVADGFAISAPSEPLKATVSDSGTAASPLPTHTIIWRLPDGSVLLIASSVSPNGWDTSAGDPVDSVLDGELQSLTGGKLISKKPIVIPSATGIDCVLDGDAYHARTRIVRQGNHIWAMLVLGVISKPLTDQADRFFASFRVTLPAT
jgi:hypothetical protein